MEWRGVFKFEYITMDKSANVTFRTTEAKLFNSLDTTIALDTLERIKIENDIYIENTRVTAKSEEINRIAGSVPGISIPGKIAIFGRDATDNNKIYISSRGINITDTAANEVQAILKMTFQASNSETVGNGKGVATSFSNDNIIF